MAVLEAMDDTGDTKTIWDKDNPDEVEMARRTFDDLKARGYMAYSVDKEGEPDSVVNEFDPNAERLILRPAMAGG
jgi:hypothetical protein